MSGRDAKTRTEAKPQNNNRPAGGESWGAERVFDPQGRASGVWLVTPTDARYGLGVTPTDARAHPWISVWMTEHNPHAALHVLPRVVPEGWRFEIYLPPDVPICRAMIPEGW